MTRRRTRTVRLLCFTAGFAALTACPVPASYTTATSAPVAGHIAWGDGAPASDLAVVLATEWAKAPCGKVALQTRTNDGGAFALPATSEHHSVMWFIPNLDIAAPRFDICVSVHDTVRHVYTGVGSLSESADHDSLDCVVWRWAGSPRASCNGHTRQAIVTGGSWSDSAHGGRTGFYRLLLSEEPTQVKGYKKGFLQDRPYVYVQWVEPSSAGADGDVRLHIDTTLSLPINRNKVTSIERLQLWRREGRWMASLDGYKKDFMSDFDRAELVFALGAPGEATLAAGP